MLSLCSRKYSEICSVKWLTVTLIFICFNSHMECVVKYVCANCERIYCTNINLEMSDAKNVISLSQLSPIKVLFNFKRFPHYDASHRRTDAVDFKCAHIVISYT